MTAAPSIELSPALLAGVEQLAREAGAEIIRIYASDFEVRGKADTSPVTEADEAAERLIVPGLQALSAYPVVAEEAVSRGEVPALGETFWLVDPLDGTREFISRNGEFTVNIALVHRGVPVLGVVYVPAVDHLYAGIVGQGAWEERDGQRCAIVCRDWPPAGGPMLACSRSHGDEAALQGWLQQCGLSGRLAAGSSLKFGLIAAGQADVYPRLGRTMEWDTAAGDAVLRAAGGEVVDLYGQPLAYGKPGFENPHFVAHGRGKPRAWPQEGGS